MAHVIFADKTQTAAYDAAKINAQDINDLKAAINLLEATVIVPLTDSSTGVSGGDTIAAITSPTALTNSTGGTPGTTLAAIASGTPADLAAQGAINAVIANALASFATTQTANLAAIGALKNAVATLAAKQNAILVVLKAAGLMATS